MACGNLIRNAWYVPRSQCGVRLTSSLGVAFRPCDRATTSNLNFYCRSTWLLTICNLNVLEGCTNFVSSTWKQGKLMSARLGCWLLSIWHFQFAHLWCADSNSCMGGMLEFRYRSPLWAQGTRSSCKLSDPWKNHCFFVDILYLMWISRLSEWELDLRNLPQLREWYRITLALDQYFLIISARHISWTWGLSDPLHQCEWSAEKVVLDGFSVYVPQGSSCSTFYKDTSAVSLQI